MSNFEYASQSTIVDTAKTNKKTSAPNIYMYVENEITKHSWPETHYISPQELIGVSPEAH